MNFPDKIADYPKEVYDLFPLTFIYYRPNRAKERMQFVGFEKGKNGKQKKVYAPYKNKKTSRQNDFSYILCILTDPNDWGSLKRNLKHKGYSQSIAAVYSTETEIRLAKDNYRFIYFKFKSISEIFGWRQLDDPEWKDICNRLDKQYPTHSTGQLTLL